MSVREYLSYGIVGNIRPQYDLSQLQQVDRGLHIATHAS